MQTVATIGAIVLDSNQSSATFSNIPQNFTDLRLVCDCSVTATGYNLTLRFNGDTANDYFYEYTLGNGSTVTSGRNSSIGALYCGVALTGRSINLLNIYGYSNSNKSKLTISEAGGAAWGMSTWASLWNKTDPITSITITAESGIFTTGSRFTLSGVI